MATIKEVGGNLLELVNSTFVGASDIVRATGQNALVNVDNSRATVAANKAAPELFAQQFAAKAAKEKQMRDTIMYAGAGAAALIVLVVIVIVIAKRKKG